MNDKKNQQLSVGFNKLFGTTLCTCLISISIGTADESDGPNYATDHIIVMVHSGVEPMTLDDGRATFSCIDDNCAPDGSWCSAVLNFAGLLQCFGCTSIEPMLSVVPQDAALAEEVGLNRLYRINFQGEGVHPGMVELLSTFFPMQLEFVSVSPSGKFNAIIPNDVYFSSQWNFDNYGQDMDWVGPPTYSCPIVPPGTPGADIDMTEAWELETGNGNVIIAVLDTGADLDHPDLIDNLVPGYYVTEPGEPPWDDTALAHGTFVSGLIGARGNNSEGIAGVIWYCKIMPVKVGGWFEGVFAENVASGLVFAADNGAAIANLSLGWSSTNEEAPLLLGHALKYAYKKGLTIVVATGNSSGPVGYPALSPLTIAVGATTANDELFVCDLVGSNTGPEVSVTAPGMHVISTYSNSVEPQYICGGQLYCITSGTSDAAPQVAGLAALILSADDQLTNVDVRDIIETTADDLGQWGFDPQFGHGRINAYRAVCKTRRQKCMGDTNNDDVVDVNDLLAVIGAWGSGAGVEDVDCDYVVAVGDLLDVKAGWGLCPNTQGTEPTTLEDEIVGSGLDWPEDWDTYVDILTFGSQVDQDNANCWMSHYLNHCTPLFCTCSGECSGPDPFN